MRDEQQTDTEALASDTAQYQLTIRDLTARMHRLRTQVRDLSTQLSSPILDGLVAAVEERLRSVIDEQLNAVRADIAEQMKQLREDVVRGQEQAQEQARKQLDGARGEFVIVAAGTVDPSPDSDE